MFVPSYATDSEFVFTVVVLPIQAFCTFLHILRKKPYAPALKNGLGSYGFCTDIKVKVRHCSLMHHDSGSQKSALRPFAYPLLTSKTLT